MANANALPPTIEDHLCTQHGLHAFASMVIANLPFPPLPIMVRNGEGEEAVGSSFDLFNQAIIGMHLAHAHAFLSKDELVENKTKALTKLHANMSCHYSTFLVESDRLSARDPDEAWVKQAYSIYCNSFRDYLVKHYAVTSNDLRFVPMDAVNNDHVLLQHANSHVKGSFMLAIGADEKEAPVFTTYAAVIKYYAVDLATLPEV